MKTQIIILYRYDIIFLFGVFIQSIDIGGSHLLTWKYAFYVLVIYCMLESVFSVVEDAF